MPDTTRIIGLLSWFEESPNWLRDTVAGMSRICDHIVAVDGKYALYDSPVNRSRFDEYQAIVDTAAACNVGLTVHSRNRPYIDEMKKRTKMFQLGLLDARPMRDWFFVCDGDEVLHTDLSREDAKLVVAQADYDGCDVVTMNLYERVDPHKDAQTTHAGIKLDIHDNYQYTTPRIWRALNNMRVVGYHYNYIGEDDAGCTRELWGHDASVANRSEWYNGEDIFTLENRTMMRNKDRKRRSHEYYQARDETGIEKTLPLKELV